MIAENLHAVASHLSPEPFDATQSTDFGTLFQQYVNQFTSDASQLLLTIDSTVVIMVRLAFVTLLLLGVFLYFTRLHRRLGKDLIYGGVILAILSEIVFPLFSFS
jgi:hypothetical protein